MSSPALPSVRSARPGRAWLPVESQHRELEIRATVEGTSLDHLEHTIVGLIARNRHIHEVECVNLNPATNIMNPRAEAALSAGMGTRPSLGYAGAKYEMGLEAIEEIEVIAMDLVCQVFGSDYAEIRVGSGAMANLYAFMATCKPGDSIIVPPATIGGHVTHQQAGAAGLYGLDIHEAPVDTDGYTVDVAGLAELAARIRPKLITIGASLNLAPHPVAAVRAIADEVGAKVLFDAAHACAMFAGGVWPNPLDEGADLMTMSTYKSLGGPPGGLVLTNHDDVAERLANIAYPGLTANFDVSKSAALAITMLDWLHGGREYATAMTTSAQALAEGLAQRSIPVFSIGYGSAVAHTFSHQFAVVAKQWGDGHGAALRLRNANILASGIGLPGRNGMAGMRLGTPEIVRWGMGPEHMGELADLITAGLLGDPSSVAAGTTSFRQRFNRIHHIRT